MNRYRSAILTSCAVAIGLAGCGGASDESGAGGGPASRSGSEILFITNSNADWWNAVEKGMQDAAAEVGIRAEMRRNNTGDAQGQINRLQEAMSLPGVKAVAISVLEADNPGIHDAMKRLQDAGKVVITFDSDIAADMMDARSLYIGTDNVEAGELLGRTAKTIRPEGGKTAVFVGNSSAANARERKQGFFQGAGEAFTETNTWDDNNVDARARSNVQTALSRDPDLGALVGLWSYNATAIAEEVDGKPAIREKLTVATFDLDEAARGHIAQGNIDATVVQNPYDMGYLGVKLLAGPLKGEELAIAPVLAANPDHPADDRGENIIIVPARVIVPSAESPVYSLDGVEVLTIDEMNSWLESKGLRSS